MSPTIAAIQKLANFIPMPWTYRSPSPFIPQISDIESNAHSQPSFAKTAERGFVSKEKQLEKLRWRLAQEKKQHIQIHEGALRKTHGGLIQL